MAGRALAASLSRTMQSGYAKMATTYELRSGRRSIATRAALSAQEALLDYVRSIGCRDDEIMRLGQDALSWRGAVFRAVQVEGEPGGGSPSLR